MTPLFSSSRPRDSAGRPCWEDNPLVVVPELGLRLTPEGRVRVVVQVPAQQSWAFTQVSCEIEASWLPALVGDWFQCPEGALEKWWGHTARLGWIGGAQRPLEPIVANASAEDLGL